MKLLWSYESVGQWNKVESVRVFEIIVVDIYIDLDKQLQDAKTTAALYIGIPVKYLVKKGSKLDDYWMVEQVVPPIFKIHKDKKVVSTLEMALLWVCFDIEALDMVSLWIIERTVTKYQRIQNQLYPTENPVCNVPLVFCGQNMQFIIHSKKQ